MVSKKEKKEKQMKSSSLGLVMNPGPSRSDHVNYMVRPDLAHATLHGSTPGTKSYRCLKKVGG